jgi:hypothetical protein
MQRVTFRQVAMAGRPKFDTARRSNMSDKRPILETGASGRNRHCPMCQGAAAKDSLAAREADLLPVPFFHLVFTLPAPIANIAYQDRAVIYDLLFKASAEILITIAADPKHLGARVGITSVLHTWGSALTQSSACPYDRAGRRHLARRRALAGVPAQLLFCRCACCRACSAGYPWRG